jgi:excisionase family DNA binding protein
MSSLIDGQECEHIGCDLLTVAQAAQKIGVSSKVVYGWIYSGRIEVVKRGSRNLIPLRIVQGIASGEITWEHKNKKGVD